MLVLINRIKEVLISRSVHLHMGLFPHYGFSASGETRGPFLMDFLSDEQGHLGLEPCFLQEFRGNFLLNSRSWLEISTNTTGRTDLRYPFTCQLQRLVKENPSQAWEYDWIDHRESMRNVGLVHGLVFPWHPLLRVGGTWWHGRWLFNRQLKFIDPWADTFARGKMQIRHNLVLVTLCGSAIGRLCSQHWPELRCDSVREDHLLMGSLQNLPSLY